MIWLYLQIIGNSVERLLKEEDLWSFDRSDLENAAMFLILKNASHREESSLQMRELIASHFTSDIDLVQWSKDTIEKVHNFILRISFMKKQIYSLLSIFLKDAFMLL